MEGDFIKINKWLLPLSWLYGLAVRVRNALFDVGLLKSESFDVPVISVGNITVGGTGKTPHVEYLVELLRHKWRVAVLSRGYKRKSRGYIVADNGSTARTIGDEPWQMKQKYPDVTVAVDRDRRHGIRRLTEDKSASGIDVVLLDDAFQHRGKDRADIVIVTKCPADLKPMEFRVITKAMNLYPYQNLYFTRLDYKPLRPLFAGKPRAIETLGKEQHILLLTGIASPRQMMLDLAPRCPNITPLAFADHHAFTPADAELINSRLAAMPEPRMIVTTEKDAARLLTLEGLADETRRAMYVLPVGVKFMLEQEENFNENIIGYVRKNSRNSILAKAKDDHKPKDGDNTRHRPGTISFRNN